MSIFSLILFIATVSLITSLSFLVIRQNPVSKLNRSLFSFMIVTALWIVLFFLTFNVPSGSLSTILFRFSLGLAALIPLASLYFVNYFPDSRFASSKYTIIFITIETGIVFLISAFTSSVGLEGNPEAPEYGNEYFIFAAHILFISAYSLSVAFRKYLKTQGEEKLLIKYFFWGFCFATIFALINNVILPSLISPQPLESFGILTPILLFSPLVYTIARHRFLNIRMVTGKVFFLFIISILPYTAFYLINYLYTNFFSDVYSPQALVVGGVTAPLFSIIFLSSIPIIRSFLNSRYVYLEYDPEKEYVNFYNKVSSVLELTKVIDILIDTFNESIQPKEIQVLVSKPLGEVLFITDPGLNFPLASPFHEGHASLNHPFKIYTSHDLRQSSSWIFRKNKSLREYMKKKDLEVLVHMYLKNSLSAYILLGEKKDYSVYDEKDVLFLEKVIGTFTVALERAALYLERLNSEQILKQKVDEATAHLRRQKQQLQEKYQFEKDMMGIMGHELRTPMTVARGIAELVISKAGSEECNGAYVKEKVQKIHSSIMKESDLIQTMLSTAHIDNSKVNLQLSEVNLDEVIEYAVAAFKKDAEAKGLSLSYEKPVFEIPTIQADPSRTQEVITNLVSNGVKYTNQGYVKVSVTIEKDFVCVNVEDSGIGIPKKEMENIGRKFYRIHQHLDKKKDIVRAGGTGLGLYVVKGLLSAMGGELRVKSVEDKGSTFTAVFPFKANLQKNVFITDKPVDDHDLFQKLGLKIEGSKVLAKERVPSEK